MTKHNKYFFLWFLLILSIVGCQRKLAQFDNIEDPNSPLLSLLMEFEDFPFDWQISGFGTIQKTESLENSSLTEEASRHISGTHNNSENYVRFMHIVNRYESDSPSVNELDIGILNTSPTNFREIPLEVDSYGEEMVVVCYTSSQSETSDFTDCQVTIRYGSLISSLIVYGTGEINKITLEQTINQILRNIDKRIAAFKPE